MATLGNAAGVGLVALVAATLGTAGYLYLKGNVVGAAHLLV